MKFDVVCWKRNSTRSPPVADLLLPSPELVPVTFSVPPLTVVKPVLGVGSRKREGTQTGLGQTKAAAMVPLNVLPIPLFTVRVGVPEEEVNRPVFTPPSDRLPTDLVVPRQIQSAGALYRHCSGG